MYKLCLALAFLAVAAAKPNWPLSYSAYPAAVSSGYPATYPAYGSAAVYSAPHAFSSYAVVPNEYSTPVVASVATPSQAPYATSYSYYTRSAPPAAVVNPVVTAPITTGPIATAPFGNTAFAGYYPTTYNAAVAPFAGVVPSGYAYGTPFSWKKK